MTSLQHKYQQKIFKLLVNKSRQLREQQDLIWEENYLHFMRNSESAERQFDDILIFEEVPQYSTYRDLVEENLSNLKDLKLKICRHLDQEYLGARELEEQDLLNFTLEKIDASIEQSKTNFESFIGDVEFFVSKVWDIYEIQKFYYHLEEVVSLQKVVLKNQENKKHILNIKNIREFFQGYYKKLKHSIQKEFQKQLFLVKEIRLIAAMENQDPEDLWDIPEEPQQFEFGENENRKEIETWNDDDEKTIFGSILCPDPDVSAVTPEKIEKDINFLRFRVQNLMREKSDLMREIREKQKTLLEPIEKLLSYEKSIQELEKDWYRQILLFQDYIALMESESQEYSVTTSKEPESTEIQEFFVKMKGKFKELKENNRNSLTEIELKQENLTKEAFIYAKSLGNFQALHKKIYDEKIQDLTAKKCEVPTDEKPQIDKKIQKTSGKFAENCKLIDQFLGRPVDFQRDTKGRFYLNSDGLKVYKEFCFSPEYLLVSDGSLMKIKDGTKTFEDDNGIYFYFELHKIYTKYRFNDGKERYFIDVFGEKFNEESELSGNLHFEEPETDILSSFEEFMKKEPCENLQKLEEDFNYIKETVGVPLRKGLAIAIAAKMDDPIDFLAHYLLWSEQKKV